MIWIRSIQNTIMTISNFSLASIWPWSRTIFICSYITSIFHRSSSWSTTWSVWLSRWIIYPIIFIISLVLWLICRICIRFFSLKITWWEWKSSIEFPIKTISSFIFTRMSFSSCTCSVCNYILTMFYKCSPRTWTSLLC